MNSVKIGISGSHSTGKTTFINKVARELRKNSIKHKIITDVAIKCPLPILYDHTVESTLWIAAEGITTEIHAEHNFYVVIVDRPILDCWAYFNAVCENKYQADNPKLMALKSMVTHWLSTYDLIYQTEIDESIPVENNKGRVLDPTYRKKVGQEMIKANELFSITPQKLSASNADLECDFLANFITSKIQ